MARTVLTVRVAEVRLRESGDEGDAAGENVVNVALLWPRPGKAEVMGTTGLVRLRDHGADGSPADAPAAFDALVLKEVVDGDVALLVHVLDRDERGALGRFFRDVAAAVVDEAPKVLGLGGAGLIRVAFSEAAERGAIHVAGGKEDEHLDVVAVGQRPVLVAWEDIEEMARTGENRRVGVELRAPQDLGRGREKGRLLPGRPNGELVLELGAFET